MNDKYFQTIKQKEILRVMSVGDVDAGKSSILGRLLYDSNNIHQDTLQRLLPVKHTNNFMKAKPQKGKGFINKVENADGLDFSRVTDSLESEWQGHITIDISHKYFYTELHKVILLDVPGHKNLTLKVAGAAAVAHAAILVIDGTIGVSWQTKRHLQICRIFDIRSLIVIVNKMDLLNYSENHFNQICNSVKEVIGDEFPSVNFVPTSIVTSDNICRHSFNMRWYTDESLLELIQKVNLSEPVDNSGLCLQIQHTVVSLEKQSIYYGTIYTGQLDIGMKIYGGRSLDIDFIKSLYHSGKLAKSAKRGQTVAFTLTDNSSFQRGDIIASNGYHILQTANFEANLFGEGNPYVVGKEFLIIQMGLSVVGVVKSFLPSQDAEMIKQGFVSVIIETQQPLYYFKNLRENNWFTVVDIVSKVTVGVGIISINNLSREKSEL